MSGVWILVRDRVTACAPSDPERLGLGGPGGSTLPPPGYDQTYRVSFPKRLLRIWCPVEGCLGGD